MNAIRIFCLMLLMACFGLDGYAQEVESATTKQSSSETQPTKKTKKSKKEKQPIQHEWVDLGLPSGLKWATCNVGASSPEDYGDYFAWGETEKKKKYTLHNCTTLEQVLGDSFIKGLIDSNGNLTPSHDAAQANWGESWRMPTETEFQELIDNCNWEWIKVNGKCGHKVIGPNGNSIFLPAAGFRSDSSLCRAGKFGFYWSSTIIIKYPDTAYILDFGSGYPEIGSYSGYIYQGRSVRPVTE